VDHVARLQDVARLVAAPHPAAARDRVQELPARVLVPVGPGAGREVHDADVRSVLGAQSAAQRDHAGEPPFVATLVRAVSCP
jgi:hypothetical protein